MKSPLKNTALALSVLLAMTFIYSGRAAGQGTVPPASPVRTNAPPGDPGAITGPESAAPAALTRLRIGVGDLVKVSVFDVPEMAQTIRVNDRGDATLTLIGSLHLAGLTTDEAQASIAQKLKADNLLVDPEVSVFISEYSTQGVSVLGEVTKPGV